MTHFYTIDANLNRAAEGLRVLEDVARFTLSDTALWGDLKRIRHAVRHTYAPRELALYRAPLSDHGDSVTVTGDMDTRTDTRDMLRANAVRAEEALRVVEEQLKCIGAYDTAKAYERMRFEVYDAETRLLKRFPIRYTPRDADIYGITDDGYSNGRGAVYIAEAMCDAGLKIIQYREKRKPAREQFDECERIRAITAQYGATFLINDDVALALAVGADGVHVGQDDMPVAMIRKVAPQLLVGLSTHSPSDAQEALAQRPDYIGAGPIYATPTKADYMPVGLEYLRYVRDHVSLPYVAIGGIKPHNLADVVQNGAYCVCLVSDICAAEYIQDKIYELRRIMRDAQRATE